MFFIWTQRGLLCLRWKLAVGKAFQKEKRGAEHFTSHQERINPCWVVEDICPQLRPSLSFVSLLWTDVDPSLPTPHKTPFQVLWPQNLRNVQQFGDQHRSFKTLMLEPSLPIYFFAKIIWQSFNGSCLQMLYSKLGCTTWQATLASNWRHLTSCVCP